MKFTRITVQADPMGGEPCIRSLRIPVTTVVELVAQGLTEDQLLADYSDLRTSRHTRGAAVRR
jgi:uncharacterized protein (DUF433 family)